MKVSIIGAGNMGGAIARALAKGTVVETSDIYVANPSWGKLQDLQEAHPALHVMHSNIEASREADMVIVAVKPWLMENVLNSMNLRPSQILVSVAAGISFEQLEHYVGVKMPMYRVIPNTAAVYMESMTLIAAQYTAPEQDKLLLDMFNEMGKAMLIPESQVVATTALASCGTAFVLRYIQAAMQAGVEMGIYPKVAQTMIAQSVKGAAELLLNNSATHPAVEIDKMTTPGGITIKGINELDYNGFTAAVVKGLKACRF